MSSRSVLDPNSDVKVAGEKRTSAELGEKLEISPKKIKITDLESEMREEEVESHCSQSSECQRTKDKFHFGKRVSGNKTSDAVQSGKNTISPSENIASSSLHGVDTAVTLMDLNTKSHASCDPPCDDNAPSIRASKLATSRCIGLDLNAEDTSCSAEQNPFYPYKVLGQVKYKAASECGSSTGPLEENESFKKWNEMKRNGFLSSSHGGMPSQGATPSHGGIPVPKQRGKKKKNDVLKQKMEIAKREQVTRFTKIAAPSGLLNGLNPGIINHVRNSKQVQSIIEALVRSKERENGAQGRSSDYLKKGNNEKASDRSLVRDSGACESRLSFDTGKENTLSGSREVRENSVSSSVNATPFSSESNEAYGKLNIAEKNGNCGASLLTSDLEDESLKLKFLSLSENMSVTNEEASNQSSVSSLSVKAAHVASQWLELLYQDARGRLLALRRSKKRIQAVIQTELPFLLSKEFSFNKENDHCSSQTSSVRPPNTASRDIHGTRWTDLFNEMEKSLSEEGKHLETWMNQVREMQLQCQLGLQCVNGQGLSLLSALGNDPRLKNGNMEREFAVRAAAASIYSVCNLVTPKEDVPCF